MSKKSRGDVKKKWPYNKNTLNLQGVKIERGGCQKKAGGVRKKQGGVKKKLGPQNNIDSDYDFTASPGFFFLWENIEIPQSPIEISHQQSC